MDRRDVLFDVTVHLMGAVSLLKNSPKTGAPSNKMFDQMIKDYEASLERAHQVLYPEQAPGMTDLMVSPEAIDACLEANPLPIPGWPSWAAWAKWRIQGLLEKVNVLVEQRRGTPMTLPHEGARLRPTEELLSLIERLIVAWSPTPHVLPLVSALSEAAERIKANGQVLPSEAAVAVGRGCTCHPDEAPMPCQHKYALSECLAAALPHEAVEEAVGRVEAAANGPRGSDGIYAPFVRADDLTALLQALRDARAKIETFEAEEGAVSVLYASERIKRQTAEAQATVLAGEVEGLRGARSGVYVASRASLPERGEMWRALRAAGVKINSTWIDEDGPKASRDLSGLWMRIISEVAASERLVLYVEPDDFPLKGALIEIGAALAVGVPVVIVAPGVELEPRNCRPLGSWIKHPLVSFAGTVEIAVSALSALPLPGGSGDKEKTDGA